MKRNRAMTAKTIEVVKTTAEDFAFFFFPLITRTQNSSKQEIKNRRRHGRESKHKTQFLGRQETGQEVSTSPVSIHLCWFYRRYGYANTINTRRVARGCVNNCTSQPYNLGAVEAFSETHKLPRPTQGETGGDHQKQSGKRRNQRRAVKRCRPPVSAMWRGHEPEQTLGYSGTQRRLACCSPGVAERRTRLSN